MPIVYTLLSNLFCMLIWVCCKRLMKHLIKKLKHKIQKRTSLTNGIFASNWVCCKKQMKASKDSVLQPIFSEWCAILANFISKDITWLSRLKYNKQTTKANTNTKTKANTNTKNNKKQKQIQIQKQKQIQILKKQIQILKQKQIQIQIQKSIQLQITANF